ncbi:MAG: PQQ-binding-like beta-propeller repeat protein [Akkermansiaceae bacterium]
MRPVLLIGFLLAAASSARAAPWAQAAGPHGNFVTEGAAPAEFSVALGNNVRWRTPLPNTGQGTPIVFGGKVFVTSHEQIDRDTETGRDILGLCFDAETGVELWRRTIPGVRVTDLSSLFSDNTAASPVATMDRVVFTNVGGAMMCFDHDGNKKWTHRWVPFGRHHARQHEPILHRDRVIVLKTRSEDLQVRHTTKAGAHPLGRGPEYWTHLMAFDLGTGKKVWVAEAGTSVHAASLLGTTPSGEVAILTGRGGGHQPPEAPYGLSLVSAEDGSTRWSLPIPGYRAAQNVVWRGRFGYAFAKGHHLTIDIESGMIVKRVSLTDEVSLCSRRDGKDILERNRALPGRHKGDLTNQSNCLVGDYHYFRTHEAFLIGRVNVRTGAVAYLEVPVQVVRKPGAGEKRLWKKALGNDLKTAQGFRATQDKRNAGNGWGHVSAASPIAVGDRLYLPTMIGMVYVLKWDAGVLDEKALLSVSDLGPAGATWSLSSLSFAEGRLYARTLKELICLGR